MTDRLKNVLAMLFALTDTVCKRCGMHQSWWGEHHWWNSWQWHPSVPQHLAFPFSAAFPCVTVVTVVVEVSILQCFNVGLTHCKAICCSLFWPSRCASQIVHWRDPNAKQQLDHISTTSSPHTCKSAIVICHILFQVRFCVTPRATPDLDRLRQQHAALFSAGLEH